MPSMAPGMPAIVLLTMPLCQKPPRSAWLFTVPFMVPAGPNGLASDLPSQVQLPSKALRLDISGAGLGGPSGAASASAQGMSAAQAAAVRAPAIDRVLMLPPLIGSKPGYHAAGTVTSR